RIVNLAHGSFYMVGAYLMVTMVEILPDRPWSFWVALLVAPLGVALLGGVIEVGLLRLIYRRDPLMQLILTFGLILVIGTLVLIAWGPDNKSVPRPAALDRKSTRLNSSHLVISYAVFCLKKKKQNKPII